MFTSISVGLCVAAKDSAQEIEDTVASTPTDSFILYMFRVAFKTAISKCSGSEDFVSITAPSFSEYLTRNLVEKKTHKNI